MITRRNGLVLAANAAGFLVSRAAEAAPLNTVLDAKPFAQTKMMSCWIAAAVILLRWKNGLLVSELDVAKQAGPNYAIAFNNDQGLAGPELAEFARALGFKAEAPQNLNPTGYHNLLKAKGPLWVASRLDAGTAASRRHVRVLRGVTGDGTFDGSNGWVLDPDGGQDRQMTMMQFSKELETIAKEEIGAGHDLFSQVIHLP